MTFPFFALSKTAWMKPLAYHHANVSIEVRPSAKGVATIYDKEIVLYIASLMATKIEAAGEGKQGSFSWLSEKRLHYTRTKAGEGRLKVVKVRLCDWLHRTTLRDH